ncbi:hypothetical protein J4G08_04385 [Candidatus Poribacteria bacterium]|nr:hypothetical protein [Candidatus Poribacteria bacterium]
MNRQMYWGIAALIIILIAAGGFMYWQWSQVQQLKEQLAQDEKMLEEKRNPLAENNLPPAKTGKKWVPHDDHFHEVPVDAPDVWQDAPITQPAQAPKTHTGPLTYHKELLETHPVEALRRQAEERGHPAAKWIPPFPPDDLEAQEFARNIYLSIYLDEKDPAYEKAARAASEQMNTISDKYPYGARRSDLLRLIWIGTTLPTHIYNPFPGFHPSDYFPVKESDLK